VYPKPTQLAYEAGLRRAYTGPTQLAYPKATQLAYAAGPCRDRILLTPNPLSGP